MNLINFSTTNKTFFFSKRRNKQQNKREELFIQQSTHLSTVDRFNNKNHVIAESSCRRGVAAAVVVGSVATWPQQLHQLHLFSVPFLLSLGIVVSLPSF